MADNFGVTVRAQTIGGHDLLILSGRGAGTLYVLVSDGDLVNANFDDPFTMEGDIIPFPDTLHTLAYEGETLVSEDDWDEVPDIVTWAKDTADARGWTKLVVISNQTGKVIHQYG